MEQHNNISLSTFRNGIDIIVHLIKQTGFVFLGYLYHPFRHISIPSGSHVLIVHGLHVVDASGTTSISAMHTAGASSLLIG